MNAWLNRLVFNLDLNRESVSEPRTLSGRIFQSLGKKVKNYFLYLTYENQSEARLLRTHLK